ncbi:MAG: fimbrial biogenesis outer membrane usher protein [Hyphomicrobiales bacterium]|nr:fimbrial biogenesis outer membrane usher protein [Hyphomicrobiales bacterium]
MLNTPVVGGDLEPLFLEVMINDQPTNLIASFFRNTDGRIGATTAELKEIGVKALPSAKPEDIIYLSDIPSVKFDYDESAQLLKITMLDKQRLAKEYNTPDKKLEHAITPSGVGVVANYSLFSTTSSVNDKPLSVEDISANLNGWIYGPMGKIYGSGIVSTGNFKTYDFLRLDTTWSVSDVKNSTVYNIGDAISGGLAWTRPYRFGGFQMQKNFGLRPDLIATPLLRTSGSAAVPSTVDVYIGNFKAHSQKVDAGPFTINQIPTVSGVGNAKIVVTDATGREIETTKPFYISSNLLRKGLLDYSIEAGFARLNYGSVSNNYSKSFLGSGTFRYGVTDKFTLEGHVEAGPQLLNGGLGASFTLADRALFSFATSISRDRFDQGYQLFGSFNTQILGMNLHASTRRSFGTYHDLASITSNDIIDTGFVNPALSSSGIAKAFDQISLGVPLPKLNGGLNISFTHLENAIDEASMFASLTYNQKILGNASLSVSIYSNLEDSNDNGAYIGLSFPIGKKIFATTAVDSSEGEIKVHASASKTLKATPGSWGWRLSDTEGSNTRRSAGVSYRGRKTYSQLDVTQNASDFQADAFIDGAIVIADKGVFLANRIDDAFAVVDASAADIPVYLSNQMVGKTNKNGKLLVPGLLSYEENRLRIDTENLPVNASVDSTRQKIIPGDGSGVNVKFGVSTQTSSAVVIFTNAAGSYLNVGDEGKLNGGDSEFIIGYDGRTYIEGLSGKNEASINTTDGECSAKFDYVAQTDVQVEIGPVVCQ